MTLRTLRLVRAGEAAVLLERGGGVRKVGPARTLQNCTGKKTPGGAGTHNPVYCSVSSVCPCVRVSRVSLVCPGSPPFTVRK